MEEKWNGREGTCEKSRQVGRFRRKERRKGA
jgi:hypothetical protein